MHELNRSDKLKTHFPKIRAREKIRYFVSRSLIVGIQYIQISLAKIQFSDMEFQKNRIYMPLKKRYYRTNTRLIPRNRVGRKT